MTNAQIVQQYYIAYYGRPADPDGFNFWVGQLDSGAPLSDLVASFGSSSQPEFVGLYGENPTAEEFFIEAYRNVLNRGIENDPEGLAFWVGVYNNLVAEGASPAEARAGLLAEFIAGVENGSQRDQDTLANKIALAELTTEKALSLPDSTDVNDLINFVRDDAFMREDIASSEEFESHKAAIEAYHKEQGGAPVNFTLQEVDLGTMTIDPTVVGLEPTIEKVAYWGDGPDGNGVPLENVLELYFGTAFINGFNNFINSAANVASVIEAITAAGALDALQGEGAIGEGVVITDADENVVTVNEDGSVVISLKEGDYTGDFEFVLNVDSADQSSVQISLTQEQFDMLRDILFNADGSSRLYEVEEEVWGKVAIDRTTGAPILDGSDGNAVLDADGEPILVDLKQFIVSPGAEIDLTAPIVLTTTDNNGGTLESGFTTAGDETIVAGRLELLHQAYIDAGFGVNTLEVDAKGLFAQPLGLFNIQHVNVENLPNVYTDSTDGSTYPDVADSLGTQTSVLDLSRAVDIETLTITEGDYAGLDGSDGYVPGNLTVTGIRNGAVTTLDGSFTQTVKLNYSELQGDGVSLVFNNLSMGDVEGGAQLQVAHNAETLNIEVNGNSYLGNTDLGGELNNMVITGSGHLYIEGDLGESFHNETPVTIDASGNTGGVDLRLQDSEQVTFLGSQGNDRFMVETDEASGEVNSGGSDQSVTIVDMDGDNHFEVESSNIDITVGDGNNNLELDGGGFNNDSGAQTTAAVVAGAGANTISARDLDVVNISTGDGDNVIGVNADDITVTTGAGNDTVIVSGEGGISDLSDGGGQVDDEVNTSDTALININVGGGDNTVVLGGDVSGVNYTSGVTAVEGSSISGENITLYVEEPSDLRAAALSGIERVVLDLDTSTPLTDDTSNNYSVTPVLTLTDTQFAAIGAENFAVDGSPFGTYAQLKIIVTESTSLTDLGVDSLPPNVDLQLELRDGVTLELTAQQLHEKVAPEGITLADDNNTDQLSGSVLITGAGTDFDPFNTNDQVRSSIDGQTYFGGSLSPTDFANDDDISGPGAGTIERNEWGSNVLLDRTLNGYNRPADAPSYSRLVIDTDQQGGELGPFQTIETFLRIVGEADMAFTPVPGEIDDWGRPIEGGTAIGLGVDNGEPTNGFMVDFSGASGDVTNLAFSGFENAEAMFGNGSASRDVRVNVEITEGESVASEDSGLVSRGIQTYVVTEITEGDVEQGSADTAEFWTSRVTQNLEVLGLQGNYDDTITFGNTERGVEFLMEVAYDKFDGYAVGTLVGDFARPGASAVVNIENISGDLPAGEVMKVAGITLENATSGTINVAEGDAVIESLVTDAGAALTFNALDDLTVEGPLPSLSVLDADGVDGVFTLSLSGTANDISDTQVSGVEAVILANGADFELTFAQLADIGAENISVENPGDMATLSLEQLGEEPFAASDLNLGVGVSVNSVTIIPEPVVTLHPDTDLSGISSLTILEGTTLNMTAEQFVQLAIGGGAIEGEGTINVTAGSQADVDAALAAIDDGQTVSMTIDGDITQGTFELVTDVDLPGLISGTLGEFEYLIGGNRLTLSDVELADGVQITGEAGSVLQFTDLTGFLVNIDASGFDVDELHITDLLVSGNNVDYIFENLPEGVTKVIYNGDGDVTGRVQNVVIEEGTTIFDDISFNEYQLDSEIAFITMNLEGGTRVDGDLVLSTVEVNIADDNLIPGYLRELVINSSGTAGNNVTGNTANIIDGDITPAAYGPAIGVGSRDNNLKAVTINADQDFVVTGSILFSSHGDDNAAPLNNQPDDGVTANDDDAAIATLTVNGTADVNAGILDTSDDDIDGLNVVNNGTGTLTATLDASALDAADVFSFTGTGAVELTVVGTIDLSGSDLTAVTQITIAENADLTLTQAQFDALGAAGLVDGGASGNATLNLVEFGEDPFDATALAAGITVASITMAAGSNTLDAATDLTDVGQIIVPEGGELNLTAAQFQQLLNDGTIVGAGSTTDYTVNITDLTQADVDAGFDLTGVTADNLTVTLGEDVNLAASDDLAGASVFIPENLTLGLATAVQADGLVVDGGTNSTVVFQFDDTTGLTGGLFAQIDASGYTVTTVKALATFIGGLNAEYTIDDLPSSVVLQLFEDAEELGFLSPTNRIVVVEEDVTVPANGSGDALIFNDWDSDDEVRTLSITLEGGVVVDGDVSLPTRTDKDGNLTQRYFDTLTLISQGDSVNTIDGAIDTQPTLGGANTDENNLLNVVINATQDLSVTGALVFNHTAGSNTTATLTLLGDADVTIKSLDTTDTSITGLVVDNQGTGTLTVTGGSDALELNDTTSLTFSGTGDIVLDTDTDAGNNGIEGDDLESIDASGLSGDLDLGVVEDISSTDFVFTAGTGVTSMTLVADDLNADVNANPAETGWTFDFSSAAAGSEFHIGDGPGGEAAPTFTNGPLNIDLGANTTLYINEDTDWSALDLTLQGSQPIVLADGVTLTLTAAQASGLNIIAGPDDGTYNGQVVINDLGDYADLNGNGSNDDPAELIDYDFSGIQVPASATLADNDVTLSAATDLGNVSIGLTDVADDGDPNTADALLGQTIRFATEEQAARTINVTGGTQGVASVNVIWLFDSVSGPVNTDNYSADITRLWFLEDLVDGQNVEQLFTSLPSTIIRVDFADLNDLPAALDESDPFNRTVELAAFTNLPGGLAFSDEERLQHVENLTLDMGGEVTVGDIEIDNIVDPTVNQTLIDFSTLTINSVLADDTGDLLAADGYDEEANIRPTGPNVVGDISVGTSGGLELLDVVLNTGDSLTGNDTTPDEDTDVLTGNELELGTIIFSADTAGSTVTLTATGANDITAKAIDATDSDINTVDIDVTGLDAGTNLVFTGGSPALSFGENGEALTVTQGEDGSNDFGTVWFGYVEDGSGGFELHDDGQGNFYAGVYGEELSSIDLQTFGVHDVHLGVLADIDGNDDAGNIAFTLVGVSSDPSETTAILGEGNVNGQIVAPELEAGSTWRFENATITLTDTAILNPGAILEFVGADLVIDGDVDLSEVDLTLTGTPISVPAGSSLTLTVEQAEALTSDITGSGTVKLVGEGDDAVAASVGAHLRTAVVDLSAVVLTAADGDDAFAIELPTAGALLDDTTTSGFTVTGSANADVITGSAQADSITGGAGDDTVTGGNGADTYTVDDGTDTIVGLTAGDGTDDVLVVEAGAEAIADGVETFVATADTSNDGVATLTGHSGDSLIDVSLASGANGFTLVGGPEDAVGPPAVENGANTLIGSEGDDIINGGDSEQVAGSVDVLTGNGGNDTFAFNVIESTPQSLDGTTDTAAIDEEILELTGNDATSTNATEATLTVNYTLNQTLAAVVVNLAGVDLTSDQEIMEAVATAVNGIQGITAQAVDDGGTWTVVATGDNGNRLGLGPVTPNGTDLAGWGGTVQNSGADVDTEQVDTVTIGGGTNVIGEVYSITATLRDGTVVEAEYVTDGTETTDVALAAAIAGEFNSTAGGAGIAATANGDGTITFDTGAAAGDQGGFTLTFDTEGAISGTGASPFTTTALAQLYAESDIITDFTSGEDVLDLGIADGTASNTLEAGTAAADFASALASAETNFDASNGAVQFYFTWIEAQGSEGELVSGLIDEGDTVGLLFLDANKDGFADGHIRLVGVDGTGFDAVTDIVA